jgi:hypothetical protein
MHCHSSEQETFADNCPNYMTRNSFLNTLTVPRPGYNYRLLWKGSFIITLTRKVNESTRNKSSLHPHNTLQHPFCPTLSSLKWSFHFCLRLNVSAHLTSHIGNTSHPVVVAVVVVVKGKGKAFPLQTWTRPWGFWRLRLQNF